MNKYLSGFILLFICHTISSCASSKTVGIAGAESYPLHREVERIDHKFKAKFPGSEVQEYIDDSGTLTVSACINVLGATCHCPPLNSRAFDNLPKIWDNKDSILDRLSIEIADYLLVRTGLLPAAHIIVRLDKDRYGKSFISFYQVAQEQYYWNGGGAAINFDRGQFINYNVLELVATEIRSYILQSNIVKSSK